MNTKLKQDRRRLLQENKDYKIYQNDKIIIIEEGIAIQNNNNKNHDTSVPHY